MSIFGSSIGTNRPTGSADWTQSATGSITGGCQGIGNIEVVFPPSWETPFTGRKRKPTEPPPSPIVDAEDDEFEPVTSSRLVPIDDPVADWVQSADPESPIGHNRTTTSSIGSSTGTDRPTTATAEQHTTTTEQRIQEALNNADASTGAPDELTMDTVLEHLSNRLLMERGSSVGPNRQTGDRGATRSPIGSNRPTPSIPATPVVSKAYEESYLREPFRDERACASGAMCECNFIDPSIPFVAVEFTPYGIPPDPLPSMCVLCSRKTTQKLFYDVLLRGKHAAGVIQRYGNIVNAPGEYARECALVCPTNGPLQCLPVPMMSHQRNRYETYLHNGVRCIRQLRVSYEDFHRPSTEEGR